MINVHQPDFSETPANPTHKGFGYSLADKKADPLISIVTPFFNTGEVFYETARCLLGQSLQQWEWIIVNDGTDEVHSKSILAEFRDKDHRIRVIDHPNNLGLSAARNTGFRYARCDYVLLIDGDDLLETKAAEEWWWYLHTHPNVGFVASYHVAFGEKNYLWTGGFHEGELNAIRNRVSMICMMRKAVHSTVGGFDESIRGGLEDWDFWMRCAAKGFWGETIPEFLAWYRVRGDHSDRWQNLTENRIDEFRTKFQNQFPELFSGKFPRITNKVDLDLTQIHPNVLQANRLDKNNPHLLLILPWMVMGGAERFALNFLDQLILKGWQVSVITTAPSDNGWMSEFNKRTEDIFILPNFLAIKDYLSFIGSFINSRRTDVVLVQGSIEGYRMLPALRAHFPRLPILDYLHFVTPDWMDGGFPRLSGLYRDAIDLSITSCEQVKHWMVTEGADQARLRVCPIGVDADRWKPDAEARERFRRRWNIHAGEVVLIYAARIEAQKQPIVLVETLRMLNEQGVPFRALVAGDGSLREVMEAKISHYRLTEKVFVLGAVKSEDMPALLAAGDVFFLPSQNEGISSAIYEAMSTGLVVVGADVGGQAELVTPECGILIALRPEDKLSAAYACVLREIIENAPRRQLMGTASRSRIITGFTLEHMGEQMNNILVETMRLKGEGSLQPTPLTPEQCLERETRHVVEYLQARQEWRNLNAKYVDLVPQHADLTKKYYELLQPRPPSHWFYLWIRQLFLPFYNTVQRSRFRQLLITPQRWLKGIFIKK